MPSPEMGNERQHAPAISEGFVVPLSSSPRATHTCSTERRHQRSNEANVSGTNDDAIRERLIITNHAANTKLCYAYVYVVVHVD